MIAVDASEDTLADVLARLGWSYSFNADATIGGNAIADSDGASLGTMTAQRCWVELRLRGLIEFTDDARNAKYDELARGIA